jgi:hypothetical protein
MQRTGNCTPSMVVCTSPKNSTTKSPSSNPSGLLHTTPRPWFSQIKRKQLVDENTMQKQFQLNKSTTIKFIESIWGQTIQTCTFLYATYLSLRWLFIFFKSILQNTCRDWSECTSLHMCAMTFSREYSMGALPLPVNELTSRFKVRNNFCDI